MLNLDSAGSPAMPSPPPTDAELRPSRRRGPKPPPTPEVLRARMARAIEKLIAAMDALDAPAEGLEDDGSAEPSLGAPERHPTATRGFSGVFTFTHGSNSQARWADGRGDNEEENAEAEDAGGGDVNDEPHDEEPDKEPTLGAPERFDQRHWSDGEYGSGEPESDGAEDRLPESYSTPDQHAATQAAVAKVEVELRAIVRGSSPLARHDDVIDRVELILTAADLDRAMRRHR